MELATRLALPEPAKSCRGLRTRWRLVCGEPFGVVFPTHSNVLAGGCCSTYFPQGLIGSEPLAAASPGPRWGASIPSSTAQQLVPGQRGRRASSLSAWGRPAGPSARGAPDGRVGQREWTCQPLSRACVCAWQPARVCVHRSWGRGGGGTLLFARLFPNMAPLLRTHEKKIQWFYQNKLLLAPEITFLNVGLVATPGRSGRKTAFFKLLAAVALARAPFC